MDPSELLRNISLSDPRMDESNSDQLNPLIENIHIVDPIVGEVAWDKFNNEYAINLIYFSNRN